MAEKRALLPEEQMRIAQEHFDVGFNSAVDFYEMYEFCLEKGKYTKAAFSLNQAAESAYKTVLLVFTNYAPHEHYLALLISMVACEYSEFNKLFSQDTKEDNDRLRLLDYAYIGARYDPEFKIGRDDLVLLAEEVGKLLNLTQKACTEKIKNYLNGFDKKT